MEVDEGSSITEPHQQGHLDSPSPTTNKTGSDPTEIPSGPTNTTNTSATISSTDNANPPNSSSKRRILKRRYKNPRRAPMKRRHDLSDDNDEDDEEDEENDQKEENKKEDDDENRNQEDRVSKPSANNRSRVRRHSASSSASSSSVSTSAIISDASSKRNANRNNRHPPSPSPSPSPSLSPSHAARRVRMRVRKRVLRSRGDSTRPLSPSSQHSATSTQQDNFSSTSEDLADFFDESADRKFPTKPPPRTRRNHLTSIRDKDMGGDENDPVHSKHNHSHHHDHEDDEDEENRENEEKEDEDENAEENGADDDSQSEASVDSRDYVRIGDLVWAHIAGYPWWPSKVYRASSKGDRLLVYFFGANEKDRWAWVKKSQVHMFHPKRHKEFFSKAGKNKSLQSAIDEMRKEYERKSNSLDVDSDNDDVCYICHSGGTLILCDGCPNACHFYCADPPIESIPDGSWYCSECLKNKRGKDLLPFMASSSAASVPGAVSGSSSDVGAVNNHRSLLSSKSASNGTTSEATTSVMEGFLGKEDDTRGLTLSDSIRVIQSFSTQLTDPVPRILERQYWNMLIWCATEFNTYNRRFSNTLRRRNASKNHIEGYSPGETTPKRPPRNESSEQLSSRQQSRQRHDFSSAGISQLIAAAHRVTISDLDGVVMTGTLSSTSASAPSGFTPTPTVAVMSCTRSNSFAKRPLFQCENNKSGVNTDAIDMTDDTPTPVLPAAAILAPSVGREEDRCLLFVRYRFDDEQEHDYRLLKRFLVFPENEDPTKMNTISGEFIKSLLFQDNVQLHCVANVKYFDFSAARRGWLHMHDRDQFSINASPNVTVIKLLLHNRGKRHRHGHHSESVVECPNSRAGTIKGSQRHPSKRRRRIDEEDSSGSASSSSVSDSNSDESRYARRRRLPSKRRSGLVTNGSWRRMEHGPLL